MDDDDLLGEAYVQKRRVSGWSNSSVSEMTQECGLSTYEFIFIVISKNSTQILNQTLNKNHTNKSKASLILRHS